MNFFKRFGLYKMFCFSHLSLSFYCFNCPFLKTVSNGREHNLHLASIFRFACAVDHFRLGKAKRANYKRENLQKSGAGPTGYRESSNPGGDITLIKNEGRKPWLGEFPVTYFHLWKSLYHFKAGAVNITINFTMKVW